MAARRMSFERRVLSSQMAPKLDPYPTAKFTPDLIPAGTSEANLTGPISGIPKGIMSHKIIAVEVIITAGATVYIEGRSHPSLHWIEVARYAATETRHIPALNELRASVRNNTGTVSARVIMPTC